MVSEAEALLQLNIQNRYTELSWQVGKLSASLTSGRGVKDINAAIKRRLIDLINLASFNQEFHNGIKDKSGKYMHNNEQNPIKNAKATLEMWEVVSRLLREQRIITLKPE